MTVSRSRRSRDGITRREFEKRALAASLGAALDVRGGRGPALSEIEGSALSEVEGPASVTPPAFASDHELQPVDVLPTGITRTWIGPPFWANRLQDWRLHEGRIECLASAAGDEVRTLALLTRELIAGADSAHLSARAGLLENAGGAGFCGFLVGAGGGALDYRAAALVQKASGRGGGLLCVPRDDPPYSGRAAGRGPRRVPRERLGQRWAARTGPRSEPRRLSLHRRLRRPRAAHAVRTQS